MSTRFQNQGDLKAKTRTVRSPSFPDYSENNERFKKTEGITVRAKLESREAPDSTAVN